MNGQIKEIEPIEFSVFNRHYYIPFLFFPIVQLKGYSAAGKSLFVHDFQYMSETDPDYANSLIVTNKSRQLLKLLSGKTYDYVIMDNADILMTSAINDFILNHILTFPKTRYVIIGRRPYTCVGHPLGVGSLVKTQDKKTGEYYFTADMAHTI